LEQRKQAPAKGADGRVLFPKGIDPVFFMPPGMRQPSKLIDMKQGGGLDVKLAEQKDNGNIRVGGRHDHGGLAGIGGVAGVKRRI
jgi:hypothetical protein